MQEVAKITVGCRMAVADICYQHSAMMQLWRGWMPSQAPLLQAQSLRDNALHFKR